MTLEEGIKYCEKIAETCEKEQSMYNDKDSFERKMQKMQSEKGETYRQFATWLREYQKLTDRTA